MQKISPASLLGKNPQIWGIPGVNRGPLPSLHAEGVMEGTTPLGTPQQAPIHSQSIPLEFAMSQGISLTFLCPWLQCHEMSTKPLWLLENCIKIPFWQIGLCLCE